MAGTPLFVGLDLDYTALNTYKFFYEGVVPLLAQHYPHVVKPEEFAQDMDNYRIQHGPAMSYDLFDHTTQLGLDSDEVEQLLLAELRNSDTYLLPGAKEFIDLQLRKGHELHLVSVGSERFQKIKVACSPELHGLDLRVIMEPKGQYLARTFPAAQGYMIDDNLLADLPAGLQPLYVRTGKSQELPPTAFDTLEQLLAEGPSDLLN